MNKLPENKDENIVQTPEGDAVDLTTGEIVNSDDKKEESVQPQETKAKESEVKTEEAKVVDETETKKEEEEPKKDKKENLPKVKTEMEIRTDPTYTLKYANKEFLYEIMSIPTLSEHEYRMVTHIILWARNHGIDYELDSYGNLYLTKGVLNEGEFYPCVTAHLDTVQEKHKAFIMAGAELDIKTRVKNNKHELYVDGIGIGADDKGAIFIGLSMMEKIDVIKGAFFLEEEINMKGSEKLNERFFDDVGYVVGFDSPDFNRSAWKSSGVKLFTAEFYKTCMKPVCDKYGYTRFYSEPYTDVNKIVSKTGIMCMNFCNGGYEAHNQSSEYIIAEETDNALGMGIELVETIGRTQHKMKGAVWQKDPKTGVMTQVRETVDDEAFLRSLGDDTKYSSYGNTYNFNGGGNYSGGSNTYNNNNNKTESTFTSNSKTETKKEGEITNVETLRYVMATYEERIASLKRDIKNKCIEMDIDFSNFESLFENTIKF